MGAVMKKNYFAWCMGLLSLVFLFPSRAYAADTGKTAEARIQVSCDADGMEKGFEFVLSPESTENQNVKCGTLTLKDGGSGAFVVEYGCPGTYHYTARQTKGRSDGILYDDTVYAVDVYVTEDENGRMSAEPVAYVKGNTGKKEKLSFVNKKKERDTDAAEKNGGDTGNGKAGGVSGEGKGGVIRAAKTGDGTGTLLWIILQCAAVLILAALVKNRKERMEYMHDEE